MSATAHINAIGTAVPANDVHQAFIGWAERQLPDPREKALFQRMAKRAGIGHRWSVLGGGQGAGSPVEPGGFYAGTRLPGTAERMALYAEAAPALALEAIAALDEKSGEKAGIGAISHLVVASCTGFVAPGIDQIIAAALGLEGSVERTLIGFMGCYAAVAALRTAHHIVRSQPKARVLVVTVELSTLHLQSSSAIEPLLGMLQFGDGAAAALVTGEAKGLAIVRPFAAALPKSAELIRWTIGDQGFEMHLSGEVPGAIGRALGGTDIRLAMLGGEEPEAIGAWAVHAGGRSILDSVESALGLLPSALAQSRDVLERFGNMSSSTLMFVLAELIARPFEGAGVALAFGPGLAAEGFRFERAR